MRLPSVYRRGVRLAPSVTAAWTPLSLAGLVAWYDASNAASITSSGGAVSQWNDLSGNGYHLTQATAGSKPTTGTRTQNAKNVIDFDGGDLLGPVDIADIAQPVTLAVVAMTDNPDNAVREAWGDHTAAQPTVYVNAGVWRYWAGTEVVSTVADTAVPRLAVAVFNGASSLMRIDGAQVATGNPNVNPLRVLALGGQSNGTFYWDGWIAEAVASSGAVAGADLTSLEAYLNAKWAVY